MHSRGHAHARTHTTLRSRFSCLARGVRPSRDSHTVRRGHARFALCGPTASGETGLSGRGPPTTGRRPPMRRESAPGLAGAAPHGPTAPPAPPSGTPRPYPPRSFPADPGQGLSLSVRFPDVLQGLPASASPVLRRSRRPSGPPATLPNSLFFGVHYPAFSVGLRARRKPRPGLFTGRPARGGARALADSTGARPGTGPRRLDVAQRAGRGELGAISPEPPTRTPGQSDSRPVPEPGPAGEGPAVTGASGPGRTWRGTPR